MDNVLQALMILFTPLNCIYMLGGCVAGMVLGAIPGLSGGTGLIILLPLTFHMDINSAVALLMGIYIGGVSGGYIGSILLGIPGTTNSIATAFDGYPMTKKGESVRALSAATVANFLGTFPSLLLALVASQWLARWAIKLGPWEYASLIVCALTLVITLSKGNLAKGMLSVALGLFLCSFGFAPICGTPRFTFNNYYLYGGFSMVSLMLGIFAGTTIALEFAQNAKASKADIKVSKFQNPTKDFMNNKVNVIRSWVIGVVVGFLPGMGGTLANMLAYAQSKSASKHPEEYGQGCIDGVIAPEVANNASIGGALIPLIALSIPGDGAGTILLAALTLQGVQPGPLFINNNPVLFNIIFIAAMISAIFIFLTQILCMPAFPALLKIPYHFLYPVILVLAVAGAFMATNNMFEIIVFLGAVVLGVLMHYLKLPSSPFILSYVLGQLLEQYLRRGANMDPRGMVSFLCRPVSLIFIIIAVISVFWSLFGDKIRKPSKEAQAIDQAIKSDDEDY